jgi:hypothetical protein
MRVDTMFRVVCLSVVVIVGSSCALVDAPVAEQADTTTDAGAAPTLQICYDRGMKAVENGDWKSASDAFSEGLEIAPNSPAILFHAARCSARLGETEACRSHLEKAIRLGATTDLAADDAYAEVLGLPEFQDLAERLLANAAPHPAAEIIHEFADAELWPEGIAYDSATGDIYVGSIHRRAIYRLTPEGSVEELGTSSEDGLMEVLGIWVDADRRRLWAATGEGEFREPFDGPPRINELVRYDLETARLEGRWPIPDDELRLLNDVATGPDGTAWATDTVRGELFRVGPDGELELFHRYPELVFLNGIAVSPDDGAIYLGHFAGLSVVSPDDGAIVEIEGHDMALGMVDGLSYTDGRLVLVQNSHRVNFRVVRVDLADDGLEAERLEILPSGLPEGLIPYTSAVAGDSVVVVASSFLELMELGEVPPAPVVARMPLDP